MYFKIAGWKYPPSKYRCKLTGEYRPPKEGEYYISGAIPEAYKAINDLSTSFHIAKIVRIKITEQIIEI